MAIVFTLFVWGGFFGCFLFSFFFVVFVILVFCFLNVDVVLD